MVEQRLVEVELADVSKVTTGDSVVCKQFGTDMAKNYTTLTDVLGIVRVMSQALTHTVNVVGSEYVMAGNHCVECHYSVIIGLLDSSKHGSFEIAKILLVPIASVRQAAVNALEAR